jgi:hypothetical protein
MKMKLIKTTATLILLLSFGFDSLTFGQLTSQSLVDKFFNDYQNKGAKIAVEELYKTNIWTTRIKDKVDDIKNKLESYNEELVGKYYGYVFIDKIESSDCFAIYSYLLKFDRQPLRLTFKLYKPNDKWILYSFSFDDSFDEDLEKSLIWKYTNKDK